MRQDLSPLLKARSVAIVGISELPRFGGVVHANLRAFGYPGKIFGVNPKYRELYGMPCYPSLRALPERPELVILALPNARLLEAMCDASEMGIPAAAIFASAHSDAENGADPLQAQLAQIAAAAQMVVCGPNCMGFHAIEHRLVVSGYPIAPIPGGNVAFITHSGSQFDALWQNRRGIHFNYLISAGNEMVTTLADYMQFALQQDSTRVVGLFLETVRDPGGFVAALALAAERDVPVVALKVGRSARGAALAQAHSGALAGEDAVYEALFRDYGVRRVKSPDEMLDTLELFARGFRTPTRCIASVHDSGGERGLLVDLAEQEGVPFAPIGAATTERLARILEPGLAPVNPVDAWGTGNRYDEIYRDCLVALDADPLTGLNVFAVDLYGSDNNEQGYVEVAAAVRPLLQKPFVFLTNLAASADEIQMNQLRALGIPVLEGTENGIRAIKHLLEYSEFARQVKRSAPQTAAGIGQAGDAERKPRGSLPSGVGALDEFASKQLLQAYGIDVPHERIASSLPEALAAGAALGYPLALKTAAGSLHKSDAGGVKLALQDAAQLATAYASLQAQFGARVLVQEMISGGVELLLGVVNDPQFGPMLVVGLGGIYAEILADRTLERLPTTRAKVRAALYRLRGIKLLSGARGQTPANLDAILDTALALSDFVRDHRDRIAAVDINPLIALPDRAVTVDALIVTRDPTAAPAG